MKKTHSATLQLYLHLLILIALAINTWLVIQLSSKSDSTPTFEELAVTFITTPDCEDCFSLDAFKDYFVENGVEDKKMKEVGYNSFAAKMLARKYEITQVPTVVVRGNVENVDYMQGLINSVGEFRNDAFVVTKLQPPYLDLEQNKVVGVFNAIYLDDESCEECYDVNFHDRLFELMAMTPAQKRHIDVSSDEGKKLIEDYYITAVPTLLLTGDLGIYTQLAEMWPTVGTIEEDGTHVLRQWVEEMGTYRMLPDGDIIVPESDEEMEEELN